MGLSNLIMKWQDREVMKDISKLGIELEKPGDRREWNELHWRAQKLPKVSVTTEVK